MRGHDLCGVTKCGVIRVVGSPVCGTSFVEPRVVRHKKTYSASTKKSGPTYKGRPPLRGEFPAGLEECRCAI